jgi:PadR family transcriptional regulator PadR
MRSTVPLRKVASAITEQPDVRHWGYDLSIRTGLRSGVLYPILHRLLDEGWLSDGWEEPSDRKGPRRRFYRATETGLTRMRELLAEGERL